MRLPKAQRHTDIVLDFKSLLQEMDGIRTVEANPATGSVLVEHDPSVINTDKLIEAAGANLIAKIGDAAESEAAPEISTSAMQVLKSFGRFDRTVNRITRGTIDGKMAVSFLFLGLSLGRMFSVRRAPTPWHTLLWYSYSIFMQWHKPGSRVSKDV